MSQVGTALAAALAYRCIGSEYYGGLSGPVMAGEEPYMRAGTYASLFPSDKGHRFYFDTTEDVGWVRGSTWMTLYGATTSDAAQGGTLNSFAYTMTCPNYPAAANQFICYSTTIGINYTGSLNVIYDIELGSVAGMSDGLKLLAQEFNRNYLDRQGWGFKDFTTATMHDTPPSIAQWVTQINKSVGVHGGIATLTFGGNYTEQDTINLSKITLSGRHGGGVGAYVTAPVLILEKGKHVLRSAFNETGWPTIVSGDTWNGTVFLVFNAKKNPSGGFTPVQQDREDV